MTADLLTDFQYRAHQNSVEKGFWIASKDIPTKLMLIVTEIAEAMEEYRKNQMGAYYTLDGKPEGFAAELADAMIRIFDLAEYLEIDLNFAINEKMNYNEGREYLHGGKKV